MQDAEGTVWSGAPWFGGVWEGVQWATERIVSAPLTILYQSLFCTSPTLTPSSGSGVAVFARSGTEATVTDWEGLVWHTKADEARMPGFRRVENLFLDTENITSSVYLHNATTIDFETAVYAAYQVLRQNYTTVEGRSYLFSLEIEVVSATLGTWTLYHLNSASGNGTTFTLQSGTNRYSVEVLGRTGGGLVGFGLQAAAGMSGTVKLRNFQLEDVTGQANTNPSEYVSVGVGVGTELVTNGTFDTDASSWTAHNSTLSVTAGVLRVTNTIIATGAAYQILTTQAGKKYLISLNFVDRITGVNARISVNDGPTHAYTGSQLAQSITGAPGVYTFTFTAASTQSTLSLIVNNTAIGDWIEYDDVSVKDYGHGVGDVDGVKYFANLQNNNYVTNNVVTEVAATAGSTTVPQGLLMEPASTNEIGYSTGFATGWNFTNCSVVGEGQAIDGGQGFLFDNTLDTSSCLLFAVYDATNAAWITTETAYTVSADYTRISHSFTTPVGCTTVRVYPFRKAGGGVFAYRAFSVTASADYMFSFYAKSKGTNDGEIYIDGVQVEPGSVLTSYIPATTGAAETRNADSLYYAGITFPQTAGFALANMEYPTGNNLSLGATGGILAPRSASYNAMLQHSAGGALQSYDGSFLTKSTTLAADEDFVAAVRWKTGGNNGLTIRSNAGVWETWATGMFASYSTDGNDRLYLGSGTKLPILFKGVLLSSTEKTTAEIEAAYSTFACSEGP